METNFEQLSQNEMLTIDGGTSYWKALVGGVVSGAGAGFLVAGPVGAFI